MQIKISWTNKYIDRKLLWFKFRRLLRIHEHIKLPLGYWFWTWNLEFWIFKIVIFETWSYIWIYSFLRKIRNKWHNMTTYKLNWQKIAHFKFIGKKKDFFLFIWHSIVILFFLKNVFLFSLFFSKHVWLLFFFLLKKVKFIVLFFLFYLFLLFVNHFIIGIFFFCLFSWIFFIRIFVSLPNFLFFFLTHFVYENITIYLLMDTSNNNFLYIFCSCPINCWIS